MSVYLFTALFHLLLFLLMCGTLCGQVCATSDKLKSEVKKTIDLFTKEKVSGAKGPDGATVAKDVNVKDFYSPVIVSAGDYIVALAGVNRIDVTEKTNTNIVKKYIEKNRMLNSGDDLSKIEEGWTTIFAVQTEEIQDVKKIVKGLLAVAKGDKIYLLSVNYIKKTTGDPNDFNFALYFVDGAVNKAEPKEIEWKKPALTNNTVAEQLKKEFNDQEESDFLFSGSAFLIDEEKIVFALVVAEDKKKKISALIQLKGGKIESQFVDKNIPENCHPYFFSWEKKIMMVLVSCGKDEIQKIMELGDDGQTWTDSKEAFFGHYGFLKNKQTFVTIKNVSAEILLFTEHTGKQNVNLWMSDGTRSKNIGEIAAATEKITPVNFLFADGKLFSLNQQLGSGSSSEIESVKLKYLKEQSTQITDTINAWSNTEAEISRLCKQKDTFKIPCTTNGLVGFLFDTKEGGGKNEWKDKYLFEDVTVTSTQTEGKKKAERLSHGFKFSGDGAGAKWPVGKADKQYNLIDPGFTLVATVTINDNVKTNEPNSILGVGVKATAVDQTTNNNIGVLCSAENKWIVYTTKETSLIQTSTECEQGKTYSVAFVLRGENLETYVNGKQLIYLEDQIIEITKAENIDHFYFGAVSEASDTPELKKTAVTITNVLLYNRPLEKENEIKQLKPEQIEVDTRTQPGSDNNNKQTPKENTTKISTQADTSVTQTATENDATKAQPSSPLSPTTEDSAVRVAVDVLSLLFGVFTLLGRYVY